MNRTYRLVWNRALRMLQVASELARSHAGTSVGATAVSLPRRHPLAIACIALLTLGAFALPAWAQECVPSATQTCGSQGGNAGAGGGAASGQGGMGNGGGGQGAGGAVGAIGTDGNGGAGSYGDVQNPGGAGGSVGATSIGSVSITGGDGVTPPPGGNSSRGSGGGGGGGDGVYTTDTNLGLAAGLSITGGNGGNGAPGDTQGGGGGGGGAGVVALTAATSFTNAGSIAGGDGGDGAATGWSGGGGGGGDGVLLAGAGSALNNSGTITGGDGGTGPQAGYAFGTGGTGGSGVNVTADNTQIINSGTITAGLSANGTARGDAVKFWGTGESLTLKAGSVLNGAVEVLSGASATITAEAEGLDLAGGTPAGDALIVDGATTLDTDGHAFSVSGAISGSAPLMVNGGGTLTLAGTNTFSGGTTVTPGTTLSVSSDANLGAAPTTALPNQGAITLDGGTLENTQAFTTARNITLGSLNGGTFDTAADLTVSGVISGPGMLFKQGAGTLTLTQANTYMDSGEFPFGTELDAGTLQIDNVGALGSGRLWLAGGTLLANTTGTLANAIATPGVFSATIAATTGNTLTLTGGLNWPGGSLHFGTATDTGTVVWNPVFMGTGVHPGLFVDGGTLQLGADIATYVQWVDGVTTVAGGATLDLDDQSGIIISQLLGGGTVATGSNLATVLTVASGSFTGGIQGAGGLTLACDTTFSCAPGVLTLGGSGLTTYGGPTTITNTYTLQGSASDAFSAASATTVDAGGVLDLGGFNQTIGSLAGNGHVVNSGSAAATLTVGGDVSSTTFGGVIQDGTAAIGLQKTGTGSLTLDGINTYTGLTEVQDGALIVGDAATPTASIAGGTQVDSGAMLAGFGTAGGAGSTVAVQSGGILSPGAGSNSIGTLNVGGGLTLAQGSVLDFDVGAPAASNPNTTPGVSDHVAVAGTLTFDGGSTLNINDAGGMGPGLYNLASYGSLAMNNCAIGGSGTQCVTVGSVPAGSQAYDFNVVNNTQNQQIDLYDTAGMTLDIWDPSGNTSQLGGTGTWTMTSPTWTDPNGDGPFAMNPQPGFAIFQGTPGTVAIDDGTTSATQVSATGLQFAVDGYTLTGLTSSDYLALVGTTSGTTTTAPIIEVGDGSSASAGMTATISASLYGTAGFSKTGAGTLVLTGEDVFVDASGEQTAAVAVQAGTLQIGNGTLVGGGALVSGVLEGTPTMAAGTSLVLDNGAIEGGGISANAVAVTGQDFTLSTQTSGTGISAIQGIAVPGSGAGAGSAISGSGFTATFTGNTFVTGSGNYLRGSLEGNDAPAITGSGFHIINNANFGVFAPGGGSPRSIPYGISGTSGSLSQTGAASTGSAGIAGSNFTVENSGGIYGGEGGPTQTGTVGAGGAGIAGSGFTVTNTGKITGGVGGSVYAQGAPGSGTGVVTGLGGAGVSSLGGATVINEGTISGGASGAGQPAADAIDFTGGGNTLELVAGHPGTFNGAIVVTRTAGDAADTLELGGDTGSDSFDLGKLASGGSFGGFNAEKKSGASVWTLTGTGSTSETWTVTGGTLNGDATALQGNIAFAPASGATAAVVFDQGSGNANSTPDGTFAGVISGNGSLAKTGDGTLALTGANTYSGGTTISAGTLQGDTTSLQGAIADDAALVFAQTGNGTFAGVVSGAGTLTKTGNGTLTLDRASHAFSGATTVAAGSLIVGSAAGNGAMLNGDVRVDSGATLGGNGTLGGNVNIASGATLSPGAGLGTLTVGGDLDLAGGSQLAFDLGAPASGQPYAQPGGASDHVAVGGALHFDGAGSVLNLADAGGAGPGLYNLIGYGSLSTSGCAFDGSANACLAIGTVPAGKASDYVLVNNAAARQIDLFDIAGATLDVWNANNQAKPGQMGGGDGTWSTTSKEWTDAVGLAPDAAMSPQPGFAIFGGTAGTVAVDNGAGTVSATGLQFASDGYTLTGDTLTLVGAGGSAPVIRVGDGSSAGTGMTATIGNVLAGSAGLTKTDLGTLMLGGANTYTGGTFVDGGTLSVSGDGNLGAASGGLTLDGGTLRVTGTAFRSTARTLTLGSDGGGFDIADAGNTFTVDQALSGSGSLTKRGAGTLLLTGANTYTGGTTISAGTLQGDTTSLQGVIANDATLSFVQAGDGSFNGTLSGSGSLLKSGAGTLTINGANPFAGATTVQAGTLVVGDDSHAAATLGGTVTVAAGATLGGIGTLGGLDLAGTLSPGNSVGTLHVSGNATIEQDASMRIDATPDGHADQLAAGGKVDILGGSALVLAQSGNWAPRTDYTIVTAAGGVSGQFASATSSLAFLVPVLSYTANAVNLSLQRNDVGFADVGATPNEKAVAHGAESLGLGTPVYDALVKLDAAQARHAFDNLTGEIHPDALGALIENSRYVRDATNRHLLGLDDGAEARTADGTGAWLSGWGHWGSDDGDGNAAPMRANGSGVLLGADRGVGNGSRIGVLLGHVQDSLNVAAHDASAHVLSHQLGVYGDMAFGALQLRAAAIHGWQDVDTHRHTSFPGLDERLDSHRHVRSDQAYVEAGYRLALSHGRQLEPFANLARTQIHADALNERDGQTALTVAAADPAVNSATLGLRGTLASRSGLRMHASIAWQQSWGDLTPVATMRFLAGGDSFAIAGVPLARHAALANLGVSFPLAHNVVLDASYLGQFATRYRDQGARMSFTLTF